MLRVVRALAFSAVAIVTGGCSSSLTEAKPLAGSVPVDVTLHRTIGVSGASPLGLPRVRFRPTSHGIVVQYDLLSGPCMLESIRAERAGHVVAIWIVRGGDPGALCAPAILHYEYIATATGLPLDTYEVRLIDQLGDGPGYEIGHASVTVSSAPNE